VPGFFVVYEFVIVFTGLFLVVGCSLFEAVVVILLIALCLLIFVMVAGSTAMYL